MTDKPRVEPSVSEPARQATCKHCAGHGQVMIMAGDANWWEKCGYCNPEPVIAPQPPPPTTTELKSPDSAQARADVGQGRAGDHASNPQRAKSTEVAPQPTPEPPRIIGVDWAKGPDYTVFPCPHCKQEIKIEQLAAPQGVGKLSPEPVLCDACGRDLAEEVGSASPQVMTAQEFYYSNKWSPDDTEGEPTESLGAAWAFAEKFAKYKCAQIESKRTQIESKGVEGVGHTARELDADSPLGELIWDIAETHRVDMSNRDFPDGPRLDEVCAEIATKWAERETLTLRAELQQAREELEKLRK